MSTHPFNHILLATEHTEFDIGAERLALQMALHCKLPLRAVLPILSNPEYEVEAPQLAIRAEREAAAKVEVLRSQAQQAGVELEISTRRGPEPYREIVEAATLQHSDLIIARRRGKQGFLARLLVGEMVSKVVSHAPCSVLLVPRASQMWSQHILAGIDNSPNAQQVARLAAKIAAQCGMPLTFINVISHDTNSLRLQAETTLGQALAISATAGVNAESRIMVGKYFEQILFAAKELLADLIVVGRHGESNLIHTPFGSTTQKIIGLAEGPVLIVRS